MSPLPPAAPPFMHETGTADDLAALLRQYEGERDALLASGRDLDDPEVADAILDVELCRGALVAVRVADAAIARAYVRGRLRG